MLGPALLHSVSYSGSWGQAALSLDAFVDKAADLGFPGVMLMAKRPHLSPLDFDNAARRRLRAQLDSRGISTVVLAGYTNFTADLEHSEIPHREIQIQYVVELARLARDIGAPIVRIFTGYDNPVSNYTAQWNMIVAAIQECARRAAPFGVMIGVQNHHDMGVGYQSLLDMMMAINEPNCKPLFDAWAPALHGDDLYASAKAFGSATPHTTIADYQVRPRYKYNPALVNYDKQLGWSQAVPMGEGFVDYRAFLSGLVDGGFTGSLAYEMCSPLLHGGSMETLDRYARQFLAYIEEIKSSR
jgi:sugar phosphate isomerase/epimerase